MTRHALKLMWNRKRQNALVLLEILGSFLVLFSLFAAGLALWLSWQRPVGFEGGELWTLVGQAEDREERTKEGLGEQLAEAVRSHHAVQAASLMVFGLYTDSGISTLWDLDDGRSVFAEIVDASPGIEETLGLEVVGRFYSEADRQDAHTPIVVNRALAERLFGEGFSPEGQIFAPSENSSFRVVGLVEYFRKAGELAPETPMLFRPIWQDDTLRHGMVALTLRMQPGSPASLEQNLIESLRLEAPTWSFDIVRLEDQRTAHLQSHLAPLAAGGVVAGFLLLMVGLGLTGVLWQNVSRRTREIGLRRAQGATAGDVRWQIILELLILTFFGVLIGGLVAVQLPLSGLFGMDGDWRHMAQAFMLAAVALFALTLSCGLYPSWLATRIQPAQALQHS